MEYNLIYEIMRKALIVLLVVLCYQQMACAKSYPFDMKHSYEVEIVRVGSQGTKYLKVFKTAGSIDKAINGAMQDAVAACIFTGVEGKENAGRIQPLVKGIEEYNNNKKFFNEFFKKGKFMNYVKNVNSGYPSGEDNVKTRKGHRVCVYVIVMYDKLRNYLEDAGLVKRINSYFK